MPDVDRLVRNERLKLNEAKWTELKKRGIHPPKDDAERIKRLREAHATE